MGAIAGPIASAAGAGTEAGFNVVGGIVGAHAAEGDRSKAEQAYNDSVNEIMSIGAPPDLAKEIILQKLQAAGVLNPQMEQAINAGVSQLSQIQPDQTGRSAQLNALQQMQQVGQTGLRPEDMAALNQIRQQVAQDTESKRQQIIQNYQQRGQGGSGAELAAQLQGAQAGSNQASQQGDQVAAQASQRALQALQSSGQMGGQLQNADTSLAAAKAQAADAFKQFDTQNAAARQQRNVSASNQAQLANLNNAQNISNANAQMANAEKQRQLQGAQQTWADQVARAQARSGAQSNLSNYYANLGNNVAANQQALYSGVGQFLGEPAKAFGGAQTGGGRGAYGSTTDAGGGSGPNMIGGGATQTAGGGDNLGGGSGGGMGGMLGGLGSMFAAHGAKVPGTPTVPGVDSEVNDTKPYMLSPGEVVIPASIAKSDKLHEVYAFLRNLETHTKGSK